MKPETALADLRRSQDRELASEGIPMVLALVSEVGAVPVAADPATLGEGRRLAREMDGYRDALLPSSRDDDLGGVISVLQVVAYTDFGAPSSQEGQ